MDFINCMILFNKFIGLLNIINYKIISLSKLNENNLRLVKCGDIYV